MLFFITDRLAHHLIKDKNIIFISYALCRASMFQVGTETVNAPISRRMWGNPLIFGILIHVPNDFLVNKLDIMYGCSLSGLKQNHIYDMNHRVQEVIYPIVFEGIDDFAKLKYNVSDPVMAQIYYINSNNKRFTAKWNHWSRRIVDGVNKQAFKQVFDLLASK